MKLIDSSCWVDYYRADGDPQIQAAVAEAIESDEAATCGMIRVEILGYIARQAEYETVSEDFSGMHDLPVSFANSTRPWRSAARCGPGAPAYRQPIS